MDWVSKDTSSYSYPQTVYPGISLLPLGSNGTFSADDPIIDQASFDPYKADAGNGRYANGSAVQPPPDPRNAYAPWNVTAAKTWLKGLKNKPLMVAIDNEIEIASSTHQDMHPA